MDSAQLDLAHLIDEWHRLGGPDDGGRAFGAALGAAVPYSGSIGPRVELLEVGHARVAIDDRREVRNHLGSIHALALANLGEIASGLAMLCALPATARGIVTDLHISFRKKARGVLTAECRCTPPRGDVDEELTVESEIRDADGDVVAITRVQWKVGPRPS